jgi:hypothetical protein
VRVTSIGTSVTELEDADALLADGTGVEDGAEVALAMGVGDGAEALAVAVKDGAEAALAVGFEAAAPPLQAATTSTADASRTNRAIGRLPSGCQATPVPSDNRSQRDS